MTDYPLKSLQFYRLRKDFDAGPAYGAHGEFTQGRVLQLQEAIHNIHDMVEILHFEDHRTNERLTWVVHVAELHERWQDYLESVPNPLA
jgi:hypothetical protein